MAIRTIEVICTPCGKCEQVRKMIEDVIKNIEIQNKIKIAYDYKHTPNLRSLDKYSVNASQAPVILINGKVELCGRPQPQIIKNKIESIHRS